MTAPREDAGLALETSDPVVRNPYRVLGLPGDARGSEIRAAAERLRTSPRPERTTAWDLPWLGGVRRNAAEVERAVARLADPAHRLRARLFWFHERISETAVYELNPATVRNALEGWSATSQPLARHDAAVVARAAALALDPDLRAGSPWRRAFEEWERIPDLEEYWLAVLRLEMEGGFESPASLADVRDLREDAGWLAAEPLLDAAREAVIAEDLPRAARTLEVLRQVLPETVFESRCRDLAAHVMEGLGDLDPGWGPEPGPAGKTDPEPPGLHTQNPALWDMAVEADEEPGAPSDAADESGVEATPGPVPQPGAGPARDPGPAERARPDAPPPDDDAPGAPGPASVTDLDGEAAVAESEPPDAAEAGAPTATDSSPGDDIAPEAPSEPEPARPAAPPPPAAPRPTPRRRARARTLVAALALLSIVATAAVLARVQSGDGAGGPGDAVSERREDVEERMEAIDGALAAALVERHRLDDEIEVLRESVEGYQVLVDDYERRIRRRLPADRVAYRRVADLRDEARARLEAALEARAEVDVRVDRLSRMGSALVVEWNAVGPTGSEGTAREPSPR